MTQVAVSIGDYKADISAPLDISIPVHFEAEQLSAFGSKPARRYAYRAGSFVGDVREGGSCNCEVYHFSPHLNGTHTECVGHITEARICIQDVLEESLIPATLVSVTPVPGAESRESYTPALRRGDMVITSASLREALAPHPPEFLSALIIRTWPNDPGKPLRDYADTPPPFFSTEAMEDIAELGIRHLVVDMPSIDRADDDGKLSNHRVFWDVQKGEKTVSSPSRKTVTELVYVPDSIGDGPYLLNLQVAAFAGDASPSRPVLYRVKK